MTPIGDEILMAYVDGELDPAAREEVERAIATDPATKERVERERRLRNRIAGHYAPVADEPIPERLTALLTGAADNVVSLESARARRAPTRWQAVTALAATLVLGLFVGTMLSRGGAEPVAFADGAMVARGELAEALESRLAADPASGGTRVGVSFAANDDRFCRTFESTELSGLACRGGEGWEIVMAAAPAGAAAGEYRQASSAGSPLVLEAAQNMIAGEPLDAEGERRARALGWRNPGARD